MDRHSITPLEGDLKTDADTRHLSTLITETHHSTIELGQFNGQLAVIKTCRNQNDSRTLSRFLNEVDALKLIVPHVSRLTNRARLLIQHVLNTGSRNTLHSSGMQTAVYSPSHCVPSQDKVWTSTLTVVRTRHSPAAIHPHYGSKCPAPWPTCTRTPSRTTTSSPTT